MSISSRGLCCESEGSHIDGNMFISLFKLALITSSDHLLWYSTRQPIVTESWDDEGALVVSTDWKGCCVRERGYLCSATEKSLVVCSWEEM